MSKKDITQKHYFNDNEKFADVMNAVNFHGKQVIKPSELQDVSVSFLKADEQAVVGRGKLREELLKQDTQRQEERSMCKALEDMLADAEQEGIMKGRAEGRAEAEETIANLQAEAEKTIINLQKEIEELRRQLGIVGI